MKHPLTSKERRGLVAVAAAALLCIGSGFVFRSCGSRSPSFSKSEHSEHLEKSGATEKSESPSGKSKREEKRKHREKKASKNKDTKKKATKKKTEKTYPSRSPLDEPIEQ